MRKLLRWLGYAVAGFVGLVLIAAAWIWFASWREINCAYAAVPERLARPSAAQLADAPRQARVLGCVSCHGEGLRGHRMFDEPGVATVWAPNLTEIAARANDQQLARAIRQGIGVDGRALWIDAFPAATSPTSATPRSPRSTLIFAPGRNGSAASAS